MSANEMVRTVHNGSPVCGRHPDADQDGALSSRLLGVICRRREWMHGAFCFARACSFFD
jgi:hypothetical protein